MWFLSSSISIIENRSPTAHSSILTMRSHQRTGAKSKSSDPKVPETEDVSIVTSTISLVAGTLIVRTQPLRHPRRFQLVDDRTDGCVFRRDDVAGRTAEVRKLPFQTIAHKRIRSSVSLLTDAARKSYYSDHIFCSNSLSAFGSPFVPMDDSPECTWALRQVLA